MADGSSCNIWYTNACSTSLIEDLTGLEEQPTGESLQATLSDFDRRSETTSAVSSLAFLSARSPTRRRKIEDLEDVNHSSMVRDISRCSGSGSLVDRDRLKMDWTLS